MEIESTLNSSNGDIYRVIYNEDSPLKNLSGKSLNTVHAFCFFRDKLVIVYSLKKGHWAPPGGGIEKGETIEQAVAREAEEETNMRVLRQEIIGYQDVYEPSSIVRQSLSFCIVEPCGYFIADPDGDITEIKLIDPLEYKRYFDWGPIGKRLMAKALEMKRFLT